MSFTRILASALVAGAAAIQPALAADITGAGATFPYPIYAKWADAYKKNTGNGMNYQSIGSGGGIKQITAKTVDFGASDMPLKAADLEKDGLTQFPMVMGGVVPVVNIEGIKPGELKLDGKVISDIYLGKVTKWNDPAIAKVNAGYARVVPLEKPETVAIGRGEVARTTRPRADLHPSERHGPLHDDDRNRCLRKGVGKKGLAGAGQVPANRCRRHDDAREREVRDGRLGPPHKSSAMSLLTGITTRNRRVPIRADSNSSRLVVALRVAGA